MIMNSQNKNVMNNTQRVESADDMDTLSSGEYIDKAVLEKWYSHSTGEFVDSFSPEEIKGMINYMVKHRGSFYFDFDAISLHPIAVILDYIRMWIYDLMSDNIIHGSEYFYDDLVYAWPYINIFLNLYEWNLLKDDGSA